MEMFKKLVSTVIIGVAAAVAYHTYKNRNKTERKSEEDKVVHFIEEEGDSSAKIIEAGVKGVRNVKHTAVKIEKTETEKMN